MIIASIIIIIIIIIINQSSLALNLSDKVGLNWSYFLNKITKEQIKRSQEQLVLW